MTEVRPPSQLIKIKDVQDRVAMSKSQIYAMVARGRFPAPHRTSAQCSRWLSSDIDDFIRAVTSGSEWSKPSAVAADLRKPSK